MIARLFLIFWGLASSSVALADRGESRAYVAAADAAFAKGHPRDAEIELLNATKADPDNAIAWMYRARVALALGDVDGADAAIGRAIKAGFLRARTRHFHAHVLLLRGDAKAALEEARADRVPAAYQGYAARMRGRALADLGDSAAARREFATALAILPRSAALWIDFARFLLANGDQLGAIDAANQAVALAPRMAAALVLKGELVRDQYGLKAALPWFDRALAIDRLDGDALLARAAVLGELGRYREMLKATRALLMLEPHNARAFYLQAVLAARARKFTLAQSLLDRTEGALDAQPATQLLRGAIAIGLGNPGGAKDVLAALVQAQPENYPARRLLAIAQWQTGDPQAVIATLLPMVAVPESGSYELTLIGRAYEAIDRRDLAVPYLDRAAFYPAILPNPAPDDDQLTALRDAAQSGGADANAALIRALLTAGWRDGALQRALALEAGNPGAPEAHMLAGDVWSVIGRFDAAAEAYRRAANLHFSSPIALRLADALGRAGQGEAALAALRLYLDQNPRDVAALRLHTMLLMRAGRYDAAIPVLEDLRWRLGRADIAITSDLAWCYYRRGRTVDALNLAYHAYHMAPANASASHSYGWILYKSGRDRPSALALLAQAAAQAPGWPLAQTHLAEAEAVHGGAPIS